jgi:hypothetical protein
MGIQMKKFIFALLVFASLFAFTLDVSARPFRGRAFRGQAFRGNFHNDFRNDVFVARRGFFERDFFVANRGRIVTIVSGNRQVLVTIPTNAGYLISGYQYIGTCNSGTVYLDRFGAMYIQ